LILVGKGIGLKG